MKRREALKSTGILLAFLGTSSSLTLLNACQAEAAKEDYTPSFLDKTGFANLSSLVDVFIPGNDKMPSATSVGAHKYLDAFMSRCLPEDDQPKAKANFQALFDGFKNANKKEFSASDSATKLSYIESAMQNKETKASLAPFLGLLRHAYHTTEKVAKEVLVYDPIPGPYQGCLELSSTGGKMYAPI